MRKKTFVHGTQELKDYWIDNGQIQPGFVSKIQMDVIKYHLQLEILSDIELQDCRDSVVMNCSIHFDRISDSRPREGRQILDLMSAVASVIDSMKFERGMEV